MRERGRSVAQTDARRGTGVLLPQTPTAGRSHRPGVRKGVCLRETQRKASTRFTTTLLQVDAGLTAGTHAYTEAARPKTRRRTGAVEARKRKKRRRRRRDVLQLQDRITDLHGVALEKHTHTEALRTHKCARRSLSRCIAFLTRFHTNTAAGLNLQERLSR